ncbi:MAG: DUF4446 family protein, partial [Actinomycetota bacterium]
MNFSTQTLSLLAVLAILLSAAAIGLAAASSGRRRTDASGPIQMDAALQALLDGQSRKIAGLESAVRRLAAEERRQGVVLRGAVQHVGMVRYDAFEDVGGRLSFSCALLDDNGDGVVMTSINGRQDTRVYAKPVNSGRSSHNLSEEEDVAIRQALAGPREAVSAG